ncbi:MAG TPA: nitrophenyl compound nitroreductase subunit ArsF family protein [Candidatus Brocadiia bacterium]|nr:nitrophenyl compound nitroreductase subunit ArsF family protein [Candidatus Brocadiia bacterium]
MAVWEKAKKPLATALTWFVLISIGFALGKETALRRMAQDAGPAETLAVADGVMVYYLHGSFRCVTCAAIEKAAKDLMGREFAQERSRGRVAWQEVNFDEQPAMAKRYDVSASTVVVAKIRGGKEVEFRRLDEVWTLTDKPAELAAFIAGVIRGYLDEGAKP